MQVIGLRPTKRVVDEGWRHEWAVRQILQPAPASYIAHEDVQLPVRTKAHRPAIVIAVLVGIVRARMSGDRNVVGLASAQHDEVPIERQEGAVPHESVDPVAQKRYAADSVRIHSG